MLTFDPKVCQFEIGCLLNCVGERAADPSGRLGNVTIVGSVDEALVEPSDVFVDYTTAAVAKANVLSAIRAGRHVVIGSSGLTDADMADVDTARQAGVGVVATAADDTDNADA